jgi:Zn-finger nucleic acid-binding protein
MICPACKSDMIVVEHERIELDHCVSCGGTWFDADELELLFASIGLADKQEHLKQLFSLPTHGVDERARRCPRCDRFMKKALASVEPRVVIDACVRGDGFWFDGQEFGQVIEQLAGKDGVPAQVVAFLGKAFGKA